MTWLLMCRASRSGHNRSKAKRSASPAPSATNTLDKDPIKKYSVKSLLFSNSSARVIFK